MTPETTLSQLADMVGGSLSGDGSLIISGAAAFETATAADVTFAAGPRYLKSLSETGAGAVLVPAGFEGDRPNIIRVKSPQVAFAVLLSHFYPPHRPPAGIHPAAVIGRDVSFGDGFHAGPCVVVGNGCRLGNRVVLHPGVVIGAGVTMGDDVEIFPNVTVLDGALLGNRVIIHSGTVIGSDGFGFAPDGERYMKIRHTGIVQIDDDVEIGANNAIDRATFGRTWIQRGVKTDNLVHVAHNCTIGAETLLVGQVGISGSVTIGRHAILAGQAGVAGHLTIGDGAIIGPRAGLAKDVAPGETISGAPGMPHRVWLRVQRLLPGLPEIKKELDELKKQVARLMAAKDSAEASGQQDR
ncbi:MAG: UDP-3-O-(3-hydroxymyristoyl)glucosamine N-acyltransferase [Pseudomonadota bacterium]